MSNKIISFFLSFLLGLPLLPAQQKADNFLEIGDRAFALGQYEEAIEAYEAVLAQGQIQERLLIRMALMYEQSQRYPESIYYLRKAQWEYGGKYINAKVHHLIDHSYGQSMEVGESWSNYELWLRRMRVYGLGIILLIIILAGLAYWKGTNRSRKLGLGLSLLALLVGTQLARQHWIEADVGVLMGPTGFYESPGFAAPRSYLPIGPGATVKILESQDIWYRIRLKKYETWVPQMSIRKI